MKIVFYTFIGVLLPQLLNSQTAQNFWREVQENRIFLPAYASEEHKPNAYRTLSLDLPELKRFLRDAPAESSLAARAGRLQIMLPMPDGPMEAFKIWDSPVMEPELALKYPEIKTFAGQGINNPALTLRMGFSPEGFHAVILSSSGGSIIVPYASHQSQYYLCYSQSDYNWEGLLLPPSAFTCVHENDQATDKTVDQTRTPLHLRGGGDGSETELRRYRFALACTGEYGASHGGTVPAVLASLVTATNTLNSILERDLSIRLTLIPNNDLIVFLDPATDPYTNANNGGGLLRQNEDALNNIIGLSNYDIGHVFTNGCTDVGGVVSGSTCSSGKGRGVTCHSGSNVIATTLSITVHEVGHQFSAGHTFNNCPGSEGQSATGSAFEPGSGSTFLSYKGSCGSSNIPGAANLHYHGGTIEEMWRYSRQGGGNVCAIVTKTANRSPAVNLPQAGGFFIPINTPFELKAEASDADGDPLTYCWEQINLGPSAPLGSPIGNSPSFRTFDPQSSPLRSFPRLQTLLSNGSEITEVLPDKSRNLKFRITVRDNNVASGGAGITWKDISFDATATAGPFKVTSPNSSDIAWKAGQSVKVTWDVANTNNELVKCQSVNIKLSVDGGQTYPHLLISSTPNDGSESVFVPNLVTTRARIRVEAAGNIFFDISNTDFAIEPAVKPGFTTAVHPQQQQICVPQNAKVSISTGFTLGFDTPISFDILSGLPPGAGVSFSKNPIQPGTNTELNLDMKNVTADGSFQPVLRAISGVDTVLQPLFFQLVYSDFSMLILTEPLDGKSNLGLLPKFSWSNLSHADAYDFQLSTSPVFGTAHIISEASNLTSATFTPSIALAESKIYYWRIRPSNECTKAGWTLPNAFQTNTVSCNQFSSSDVPRFISGVGLPVVTSVLPILQSGTITDLNVSNIKGNHDALPHIAISLKSPKGTEVELFSKICGNTALFNLGLDDESPFAIDCPPINGLRYKPQNPLAAFKGENSLGVWTLTVRVIHTDGQGGNLEKWSLEFCAAVNPKHPFIVVNDTLRLLYNETKTILNTQLNVQDDDNTAAQLKFTIVREPEFGFLSQNGLALKVGGSFTMADINSGKVAYTNTNTNMDAVNDFFTYIVEDGNGGWLGTPRLPIKIGQQTTDTRDKVASEYNLHLYPNPAENALTLSVNAPWKQAILTITDIYGRLMINFQTTTLPLSEPINISTLPNGLYLVHLSNGVEMVSRKFVVMRR